MDVVHTATIAFIKLTDKNKVLDCAILNDSDEYSCVYHPQK